jgi:hypothetical protein
MAGLSNVEIMKIVNRYIGVFGGYLGDFSYRTHADFYPEYCNLDINPYEYEGTTRERFIQILKGQTPDIQARIVRGVLERFPLNAEVGKPATRTQELFNEILEIAKRLEGVSPIANPDPKITSSVVERAISDVETLLSTNGAVSGVDRIHTALHGYLQVVCESENISFQKDDSMAKLFKLLRQHHPALQNLGSRSQDIERVFQSFATILDALNPIRNNASVAHPGNDLLEKDEAMLVINAARTLLNYLDCKFS